PGRRLLFRPGRRARSEHEDARIGGFLRGVPRRYASAGGRSLMRVSPLIAQIGADVRMRLRSFATPIAILVYLAAAFFWVPDPKSNSASLTWDLPDGRVQAPLYSAAYVGFAL